MSNPTAEAQKAKYWARKLAERCVACGCELLPEWDGVMCPTCAEKQVDKSNRYARTERGRANRIKTQRAYTERNRAAINRRAEDRRLDKKVAGECARCSRPATDGDCCAEHAKKRRATQRKAMAAKADARAAAGLCIKCGEFAPAEGKRQCDLCLARLWAWKVRRKGNVTGGAQDALVMLVATYCPKEVPEAVALAAFGPELDRLRPAVIAHGDVRAGDRAVVEWARATPRTVRVIPARADWRRHGHDCGRVRDENAARWAEVVVGLWDRHARASGGMLRAALRHGKRVVLVVLSGDGAVIDRFDTAEGVTPDRILAVLDAEPLPRARRRRKSAEAA